MQYNIVTIKKIFFRSRYLILKLFKVMLVEIWYAFYPKINNVYFLIFDIVNVTHVKIMLDSCRHLQ